MSIVTRIKVLLFLILLKTIFVPIFSVSSIAISSNFFFLFLVVSKYRSARFRTSRLGVSCGVDRSLYPYGAFKLFRIHISHGQKQAVEGTVCNYSRFELCLALFVFQVALLYAFLFGNSFNVGGGICAHTGILGTAPRCGNTVFAVYGMALFCGIFVLWSGNAKLTGTV